MGGLWGRDGGSAALLRGCWTLFALENRLNSLGLVSPPIHLLHREDNDPRARPGRAVLFKILLGNVAFASDWSRQRTEVDELVAILSARIVRARGEDQNMPGGSPGHTELERNPAAALVDGQRPYRVHRERRAHGRPQ